MRRRAQRRVQLKRLQGIAHIYDESVRKELNTEYATTDMVQASLGIRDGPHFSGKAPG